MEKEIQKIIEEKIGYEFNNAYLLEQAFTRSSYAEEHCNEGVADNEVLEFIGDKALDFVIVKLLAKRYGEIPYGLGRCYYYSDRSEKELTEYKISLVESKRLSSVIDALGFQRYLRLGNGDIKNNVGEQPHVKEDLYEAILGAVALDSGWNTEILHHVIEKTLAPEEILNNGNIEKNYIALLQELWQKKFNTLPPYEYSDFDGCTCSLTCPITTRIWRYQREFYGSGKNKKEATAYVAKEAYLYLTAQDDCRKTVIDEVGEPDVNRAINQLQELFQKKMIGVPNYSFKEIPTDRNGASDWECTCTVQGYNSPVIMTANSKANAKKAAAYSMLDELIASVFGGESVSLVFDEDVTPWKEIN